MKDKREPVPRASGHGPGGEFGFLIPSFILRPSSFILALILSLGKAVSAPGVEPLPGAHAYIEGRRAERAGRYADALNAYHTCTALEGPLAPYARVRAPACRAEAGDPAGAIDAYRALLQDGPHGPWMPIARVELASLLAAQDKHADAAKLFDAALSFEPKPWWVDRYQWPAAHCLIETTDRRANAYAFYRNVIQTTRLRDRRVDAAKLLAQSPNIEDRATALWGLIKSAERAEARTLLIALAPDMLTQAAEGADGPGLVALFNSNSAALSAHARARLQDTVQAHRGNAWVQLWLAYLARSQTMLGHVETAQLACDALVAACPESEYTPYALWWLAARLKDKDKHKQAMAQYERLVQAQPDHRLSDDALLAIGSMQRDRDEHKAAARTFTRLAKEYPVREFAARAWYWAGLCHAGSGAPRDALACYTRAAQCGVGHFYAHRALQRLCDAGEKGLEAGPELDIDGSASLLRAFALPANEPDELPEKSQASPAFQRLLFFGTHGLEEAEWEALDIAKILKSKLFSAAVYRAMAEAGVAATAMDYAEAFSWGLNDGKPTQARLYVDYPLAYRPHVQRICQAAGIDPYLVLAMARQESTFRPALTSYAGARGVMQVMPDTAKWLAKVDPNIEPRHAAALEDPLNSFRLGVYYMVRMIDRSGGNLVYALASYNAGPGNCDKWRKRFPKADLETFIEAIPFSETRNYVKAVLANYAAYRSLYAAEAMQRQ